MLPDQSLPSLLDRLTDESPGTEVDAPSHRSISAVQLRDAVLRDLRWLLNATQPSAAETLGHYPEVQRSVLNFGMPGLPGQAAGSLDLRTIERQIRDVIIHFEPRFLAHTVAVRVEDGARSGNAILLSIEGQLCVLPIPIGLLLQSEFDLETGQLNVVSG